jgi:hypothetical protein
MDSLEARACALVNPASGIANDYLNHFNEIFLLIDNFPVLLPEMVDELLSWKPISYREYFEQSPLPGKTEALAIYDNLDGEFRRDFDEIVVQLDKLVMESIATVATHRRRDGTINGDEIVGTCAKLSIRLHTVLKRAADLVNHGYAPPLERPQDMADRVLASDSTKSLDA